MGMLVDKSKFHGKCPYCNASLAIEDFKVETIRNTLWAQDVVHYCGKCGKILGVSSYS